MFQARSNIKHDPTLQIFKYVAHIDPSIPAPNPSYWAANCEFSIKHKGRGTIWILYVTSKEINKNSYFPRNTRSSLKKEDQRFKQKLNRLTINTWNHANLGNHHGKDRVEANFLPQLRSFERETTSFFDQQILLSQAFVLSAGHKIGDPNRCLTLILKFKIYKQIS
jgi:hypothetical protein